MTVRVHRHQQRCVGLQNIRIKNWFIMGASVPRALNNIRAKLFELHRVKSFLCVQCYIGLVDKMGQRTHRHGQSADHPDNLKSASTSTQHHEPRVYGWGCGYLRLHGSWSVLTLATDEPRQTRGRNDLKIAVRTESRTSVLDFYKNRNCFNSLNVFRAIFYTESNLYPCKVAI